MLRAIITLLVIAVAAAGGWAYLVFGQKKDASIAADRPSAISVAKKGDADGAAGARSTFDPDKELQANELLIVNPPPHFTDTIRRLNFTQIERFTFQGLGFAVARLRIPSGMALAQARAQLAAELPGVVIDFNHRYDASQDSRRPGRSTGTAADQMKKGRIMSLAQAAIGWRDVPATCGKGIKLGMIDSGVDTSHPVLKGQDIEFRSFHSEHGSPGDSEHGTAVAALLVGKPAESGLGGLLPGATLKAANMFEKGSTGANSGNVVSLLRGLDWLVREKVSVINMSIAGSNNAALERGIHAATERSVLVVAAAGNWGRADKPAYPAAIEQVFAVTAIDTYEGIYEYANKGAYIDFAAPGVSMLTAAPGGGAKRQSGTSFAAPFITAFVALEIANGHGGSPAVVQSSMAKLAKDLGQAGKDATYGIGEVQLTPKCPI
jgi:hypothetical protein